MAVVQSGKSWHYAQGTEKHGPVTALQLKSLYEQGTIGDADLVWRAGMSRWLPAGQVKNEFLAVTPAPVHYDNPLDPLDGEISVPGSVGRESGLIRKRHMYDYDKGVDVVLRTDELEYAGFLTRFGAAFVDSAICTVLSLAAVLGTGFAVGLALGSEQAFTGNNVATTQLILAIVGNGLPVVVWLAYFALLEGGSHSATFGKRLFGMVVFDKHGEPINRTKALTRTFCKVISGLVLGLGFLLPLVDKQHRALHDVLAGTLVARV